MTDLISLEAIKPEPFDRASCEADLEQLAPPVCADDGPC